MSHSEDDLKNSDNTIAIAIIDDHTVFLDLLIAFFKERKGYQNITGFQTFQKFKEDCARGANFDVVLLDLDLPHEKSPDLVKNAILTAPGAIVVVVSGKSDHQEIYQCIQDGAKGFIPKTVGLSALSRIIDLILIGEIYVPSFINDTGANDDFNEPDWQKILTPREIEIFTLLPKGLTNREIASVLGLRDVTVKVHLRHIYEKLEISNRTEAAVLASRFLS